MTSFSFSITLSSSYLCRSPAMTAVLSSSIGLLDGWSLNNNDVVLSTRVRMNDFHLPLWKSGLYFLASGYLLFLIEDLSGWIKLPSIRKHSASSTWLDEQSWMGYDGYDDLKSWSRLAPKDCCVNSSAPLPFPYLPWVSYQGKVVPVLTLWERLSVLRRTQSSQLSLAVVCYS